MFICIYVISRVCIHCFDICWFVAIRQASTL